MKAVYCRIGCEKDGAAIGLKQGLRTQLLDLSRLRNKNARTTCAGIRALRLANAVSVSEPGYS
jgi:hypothetical protein